jgi:hypothetical protein
MWAISLFYKVKWLYVVIELQYNQIEVEVAVVQKQ